MRAVAAPQRCHRTIARAQTYGNGKAKASLNGNGASQPKKQLKPMGRCASPLVLSWETPQGTLLVGSAGPLQKFRPGNGGLRLWSYDAIEDAVKECQALSAGMSGKHSVYNTGFSGAKLVFNSTDPSSVDKIALMDSVAEALEELDGTIYTGCDLNTTEEDMTYLFSKTPYVLASIDNPVDANVSTGYGVFGSIQGALDVAGGIEGKTFLVKGTGKVGRVVAELLVKHGGRVLTYDIVKDAADIPGCENVSDAADWQDIECDVFVPCSVSGFITDDVAARLQCKLICGASNVPFSGPSALAATLARGIDFIPEAVSSAGAVLGDSIEMYAEDAYSTARPCEVYSFVQHLTRTKTQQLIAAASGAGVSAPMALDMVTEDPSGVPCGEGFAAFLEEKAEDFDTVVIGAGMAGTAAAYYLTKDAPGHKVAVVESTEVANKWASSYGESRMYRRMYSDEYFSLMQSKALEYWKELEEEFDVEILRENGLLFYGETDTGETVEGSVPGARDVMEKLGIPHEYFKTGEEIMERWPDINCPSDYQGVYEATAGKVHSSRACETMMAGAQKRGAKLYDNEPVEDVWVAADGRAHVFTSTGRLLRSNKVIVAAGSWTNQLMRHLGVQMDLEVHSTAYGHYRLKDLEATKRFPQWFCFRKQRGELDGGLYFGFPAEDMNVPLVKCGIDFTPNIKNLISKTIKGFNYEVEEEVGALVDEFMFENWSSVVERVDMQCSPYTMTRDQYFVLDKIPGMEQILVFTGGCGRAFKFGPLLGKCLADMALGKKPVYDVTPLAITREAVGLKMAKRKRKVPAPKAAEANGSSNGSANGSNGNSATEQEKTGRSKGTASPTLA